MHRHTHTQAAACHQCRWVNDDCEWRKLIFGCSNGSINNTISVGRNVVDVNEAIRANVVVGRTLQMHRIQLRASTEWFGTGQVGETHKINLVYVWLSRLFFVAFPSPLPTHSGLASECMPSRCHFNVCPVRTCSSESETMLGVNSSGRDKCREQLFVSFKIRWERTHTAAMSTALTTRRRRASVTIFSLCRRRHRPSNAKFACVSVRSGLMGRN